jgi:phosphopantothenoylcysteine decarboxylase / phosphopantothenate---cysteine ligase
LNKGVRNRDVLNKGVPNKVLLNKKVLITAGPTHEAIDPVRFIGNHSSGRMGFAIADAFAAAGAGVTVVAGPTAVKPGDQHVNVRSVTSAADMYEACLTLVGEADIVVFAAAVADFTPEISASRKIKRGEDDLSIQLKPTVDIAGTLGKSKREDQLFVGFALETNDGLKNAAGKLKRKNLDLIVLNTLEDKGAGFGTETNKITLMDKSGNIDTFELKHKSEVARDIVTKVIKMMSNA